MLHVRFPLSLGDVEDLLHKRGIEISHKTVRFWWQRVGPMFAAEIRKRRVGQMRASRWRWHLDQVVVKIDSVQHYLWRAVGHEGEVLAAYVSKARDKKAALTFLRKLMKRHGQPEELVTDKLRTYGAALKEIGAEGRRVTKRWPTTGLRTHTSRSDDARRRRSRRMHSLPKVAAVHGSVHNHLNAERGLTSRDTYKAARTASLTEWRRLCAD